MWCVLSWHGWIKDLLHSPQTYFLDTELATVTNWSAEVQLLYTIMYTLMTVKIRRSFETF